MTRGLGLGFGLALGAVVLGTCCARASARPSGERAAPFAVASVHFEQNATDGDVEVVLEAMGGDDGLTSLTVTAPDGRTVVSATSPDSSTLGMRQFRFESPEPTDTRRLEAAYPEGAYTLAATTATGRRYSGKATLSHRLPPATAVLTPARKAKDVTVHGLRVTWTRVPDVAGYVLSLEQGQLNFSLSVTLPATTTAFAVPDGVLQPGREYTLALGTVLAGGNASYVETSFATAGRE